MSKKMLPSLAPPLLISSLYSVTAVCWAYALCDPGAGLLPVPRICPQNPRPCCVLFFWKSVVDLTSGIWWLMLIFFWMLVLTSLLNFEWSDSSAFYWEKFRGHDGLVCFSELLTGEGEENCKLLSTDFRVCRHTSHQGREVEISSHLNQKITKHVLLFSLSWPKIVSPNCFAFGSKTELASKMSVLINREQKDQN